MHSSKHSATWPPVKLAWRVEKRRAGLTFEMLKRLDRAAVCHSRCLFERREKGLLRTRSRESRFAAAFRGCHTRHFWKCQRDGSFIWEKGSECVWQALKTEVCCDLALTCQESKSYPFTAQAFRREKSHLKCKACRQFSAQLSTSWSELKLAIKVSLKYCTDEP